MRQRPSTALLLVLLQSPFAAAAPSHSADCSSCDHSLTRPVYYGCIGGDAAYVTYDAVRVDCGAALTLNTTSSVPRFHYPDAESDALYALLLVDTTEVDPIVGTKAPFLPFPIVHYGGMNIPGYVLAGGMTLDIFDYDETGVTVRPFVSYAEPAPSEELEKVQPGYIPPDLDTRAFNYEFILGKQRYEKELPVMDKTTNWEFIGFLKRTILGNPIASTYFTTGYCVNDMMQEGADDGNDGSAAIGTDCPVPAKTISGIGSVPAHVAVEGGYGSSLSGGAYGSASSGSTGAGNSGGTAGAGSGSGESGSGASSGESGSDSSSGESGSDASRGESGSDASYGGTDSAGGSEGQGVAASSSNSFVNRWDSAAAISCVAGLMYGMIAV